MKENAWEVDNSSWQKRSDHIVENLKRLILLRNLEPGDRLPQEKELIELFQSSRGTVREALKSLEVQGLVKVVSGPKGGARLVAVPYRRAQELLVNYFHFRNPSGVEVYQVRCLLEPLLAENVVGLLDEGHFQELDQTIDICQDWLAGRGRWNAARRAELAFHNVLAQACPNHLLSFHCRFMNDLLADFMEFKDYDRDRRRQFAERTLKYHLALIEAYQALDKKRVRDLMTEHMLDAARFSHQLDTAFEQGLIPRMEFNPHIF